METLSDFEITSDAKISKAFRTKGIFNFTGAGDFVKRLPYKRNADKKDLITVLSDGYGTCSTKHALLKQLSLENSADFVKLTLGIFRMNQKNTPAVASVLKAHQLDYIPEAHNYLKINGEIVDYTGRGFNPKLYVPDLLSEIEIEPDQIGQFKVDHHLSFLADWLKTQSSIQYTLTEIFTIREKCISALEELILDKSDKRAK